MRVVTGPTGSVLARHDYYGTGERMSTGTLGTGRGRFIGKEVQNVGSLGWLDFGARMYDPTIARWTSQDPLAEKYLSWSPYVYCIGDPANYFDPDGNVIYVQGSTDFVQQFKYYQKFLTENGYGHLFSLLNDSARAYYINEVKQLSLMGFRTLGLDGGIITWDVNHLMKTSRGIYVSPSVTLAHELEHAYQYEQSIIHDNLSYFKSSQSFDFDNPYGTAEEKRVISGTEQVVARRLGEIPQNEVTRHTHSAIGMRTILSGKTPEDVSKLVNRLNDRWFNVLPRLRSINGNAIKMN